MPKSYYFTSESVTEGHPDKVADQISDGILDAMLKEDPESRVAIETLVTTGLALVAGEVTTKTYVDVAKVARDTVAEIGYTNPEFQFDAQSISVLVAIHDQSSDISAGVTEGEGIDKEQGAGDQGLMFGYATNETPEYIGMPLAFAHRLTKKLADVRKSGEIDYLSPDGKSQVTIEYVEDKPKRIEAIVVSNQHKESATNEQIYKDIKEKVIFAVLPKEMIDDKTKIYINPAGRFVHGGPAADTGLTGRKIIVDTYGGVGSHGGGCFSGKDPSKVDRSASYMARYIAKNIVASGAADKCEVQLAYAIGVSEPVSVMVNSFETGKVEDERLAEVVREVFPLKPKDIINHLDLRRPIFQKTASYGHFGRDDPDFTWEKTDKVDELKDILKLKK